jgi:hypothetical protein
MPITRLLLALLLLEPLATQAAGERFTRNGAEFSISVRAPEGTTAFYTARGFPPDMVTAIAQACLVGVGIRNEGDDVLWLELDNWHFTDVAGQEVPRITRPEWDARWEAMHAPQSARATFDWTQLPESRDLQPGEPVGGNVAVHAPVGDFSLTARFRTGNGETFEIQVPGLRCKPMEAKP